MAGWTDTIQTQKPPAVAQAPAGASFIFEEEEPRETKVILTVFGEKGVGKTSFTLGVPGTISALSFDRKTTQSKVTYHDSDPRIHVYDAVKFYDRDSKIVLDAAQKTYDYITFLLEQIAQRGKTDWVVIDGIEIMNKIAENCMRKQSGLGPYSGTPNPNVWKIRNSLIDAIHQKAVAASKRGVIYTTYTEKDQIIEEGSVVTLDKVPKYIDSVMWETDIVLYINSIFDVKTKKHQVWLRCDSSKYDQIIKTGTVLDITGKKANQVLNFG